jgi:hypothetical protein
MRPSNPEGTLVNYAPEDAPTHFARDCTRGRLALKIKAAKHPLSA